MERSRRDAENGQCLALVGLWSRLRVVLVVVVASRLSSQGRPDTWRRRERLDSCVWRGGIGKWRRTKRVSGLVRRPSSTRAPFDYLPWTGAATEADHDAKSTMEGGAGPAATLARIAAPPRAKFSSNRMGETLPGRAVVAGEAVCGEKEEGGVNHRCSCRPPRRDAEYVFMVLVAGAVVVLTVVVVAMGVGALQVLLLVPRGKKGRGGGRGMSE